MRYFLLAALLFSCGPTPQAHCVTTQGVRFMGMYPSNEWVDPEKWSCEIFEYSQNRLVYALLNDGGTYRNLDTDRLKGVEVWLHEGEWWTDEYKRDISGVTYCETKFVLIGNANNPRISAFPHELVHVMQGCNSPLPIDEGSDIDHSDWKRDGLYSAIDFANGQ